jgi:hypothetical protein
MTEQVKQIRHPDTRLLAPNQVPQSITTGQHFSQLPTRSNHKERLHNKNDRTIRRTK